MKPEALLAENQRLAAALGAESAKLTAAMTALALIRDTAQHEHEMRGIAAETLANIRKP